MVGFVSRYVACLDNKIKYAVPLAWLVLAGTFHTLRKSFHFGWRNIHATHATPAVGGWLTPKFLANTNNDLGVPSDSPSQLAQQQLDFFFPAVR